MDSMAFAFKLLSSLCAYQMWPIRQPKTVMRTTAAAAELHWIVSMRIYRDSNDILIISLDTCCKTSAALRPKCSIWRKNCDAKINSQMSDTRVASRPRAEKWTQSWRERNVKWANIVSHDSNWFRFANCRTNDACERKQQTQTQIGIKLPERKGSTAILI